MLFFNSFDTTWNFFGFFDKFFWDLYSYSLLSLGLGVCKSSLAKLINSQGRPVESRLSSRPAWGNSLGLWSDVKLVSRQSLWGGVPAVNGHLTGLDVESKARISCSISISWISRASRAFKTSTDDDWRLGFAPLLPVTT